MNCEICGFNKKESMKEFCDTCKFYMEYRTGWEPKPVNILFIAESPPEYRKNGERPYFYNEKSQDKTGLWKQFGKALGFNTNNKERFLKEFKEAGFLLEDIFPTYECYKIMNDNPYNGYRTHIIDMY